MVGPSNGQTRLTFPAQLVRGRLMETLDAARRHVGERNPVEVDASAVLEIDGPGVQLVLAIRKTASEAGIPFSFSARSPALDAALAQNGADRFLHE